MTKSLDLKICIFGLYIINEILKDPANTSASKKLASIGPRLLHLIKKEHGNYDIIKLAILILGNMGNTYYTEAFNTIYNMLGDNYDLLPIVAVACVKLADDNNNLKKVENKLLSFLNTDDYPIKNDRGKTNNIAKLRKAMAQNNSLIRRKLRTALYIIKYGEDYDIDILEKISDLGLSNLKAALNAEKALIEKNKKALHMLNKSIKDWEIQVSYHVCYILSKIGDDESASIMLDNLYTQSENIDSIITKEDINYTKQLISSLSQLNYQPALEIIAKFLSNNIFREEAFKAIVNIEQEESLQHFKNTREINELVNKDLIFNICESIYYHNDIELFKNILTNSDNKYFKIYSLMFLKQMESDNIQEFIKVYKETEYDKEITEIIDNYILN